LTPRDIEVIRLLASSMHNKEIAHKLAIAEGTMKIHLHRSYKKLHIDSRMKFLRYAQAKGLI
jgi:DNA-binding NarL/FixJ family response regulator